MKKEIIPKMCWGTDCDEDRCRCHDENDGVALFSMEHPRPKQNIFQRIKFWFTRPKLSKEAMEQKTKTLEP